MENSRGRTAFIVYLDRTHLSSYGLTVKRDIVSPDYWTTVATPRTGVSLISTWTLAQGSRDIGRRGQRSASHFRRRCAAAANNLLHSTATSELLYGQYITACYMFDGHQVEKMEV
jgi:hypothetical protein